MRLRSGDPEAIGGYPLERRLGSGGMGTVYLARTASGRRIAIKLIHQQFADDDEFRARFRQEVAAARRVSGAFTAAVVDADPEGAHPWMATTYIEGPTLSGRIAADGPLGGAALRTLAVGLAEALRDIHRAGVVHRDLKPSNVVLSPEGPRVIDFGISRAADQQTLTMTGRVIGTPPFMSPEQLQAPRAVGPESDVFSLATLLVFAATGQGPFDSDSPYMTAYQVVHEAPQLSAVPEALRAVVEPCLAKEPGARPSVNELLTRLLTLPDDFGGPALPARAGAHGGVDVRAHGAVDVRADGAGSVRTGGDVDGRTGGASGSDTRALGLRRGADRRDDTGRQDSGTGRGVAPRIGGGLRRRWRSVLAAAVAVAAIAGGVTLLAPGQGSDVRTTSGEGRGEGGAAGAGGRKLPAGFAPWEVSVRGGKGIPDELRCVPHGPDLYCGGGGVVATRLRASDGKRLWTVPSPGVPMSGMHFVGLAGSGAGSGSGAENAGAGSGAGSGAGAGAGVTVLGYRLPADAGPPQVVALTEGGRERWSAPLGGSSTLLLARTQDAVLHRGDVLSVDPADSRIESRRADGDGRPRWSRPFPAGTQCAPYSAGTRAARLYAVCAPDAEVRAGQVRNASLRLLDRADGSLGPAVPLRAGLVPVGEAEGALVFAEERSEGLDFAGYSAVALFDPRTGKLSRHPLRQPSGKRAQVTEGAAPVVAAGAVHFVERSGRVHAVDPATGRVKWARQSGTEWASAPEVSGGVLYLGSPGGRVVALDVRDGDRLWETDPRVESSGAELGGTARVAVSGRAVFVSAAGNTVFSFDAERPPDSDD